MPRVHVRPARPEDFGAVSELLAELGRPTLTAETEPVARAIYERYLRRDDTEPLIAEVDGVIAGFMSLEFRDRLNHPVPQAWIPDLIVTEGQRGVGAGRALLLHGFERAWARRCWSVTLESGHHRKAAHRLYRSAGMREEGFFFTRYPDEPTAESST